MVRTPVDQMTREQLVQEVARLRAETDRFEGNEVSNSPESFRDRLRAARPDLQVFRGRPLWQQMIIRTIWRVQALFGSDGWVPRREREATHDSRSDAAPLEPQHTVANVTAGSDRLADTRTDAGEGEKPTVVREIYSPGISRPVGFIKRFGDRIELTLSEERRAGFLDYLVAHRDEVVHQMSRSYERENDIRRMTDSYDEDD